MIYQHRSAYGLDSPRDTDLDWRRRAACRVRPDMWFGGSFETDRAAHICQHHCPVFDQCARQAERDHPRGCVQAAVLWTDGATGRPPRPAAHQPMEVPCGPFCGHPRPAPVRHFGNEPKPCGTAAAVARHRRRGEIVCDVCKRAERDRDRRRRQRNREELLADADWRAS